MGVDAIFGRRKLDPGGVLGELLLVLGLDPFIAVSRDGKGRFLVMIYYDLLPLN